MTNRLLIAAALALLAAPALAGGAPPEVPDPSLTPGVARPDLTQGQICATKWGKDERMVTEAMKQQVEGSYGVNASSCPSGKLEVDHLISRELGGADDVRNLWPQCYEAEPPAPKLSAEWGAHKKDRLENYLHAQVCAGKMTLDDARDALTSDWRASYVRFFGEPGPGAK